MDYYLDIAIALGVVYLTLSLFASIFHELTGTLMNQRGKALFKVVKSVLNESSGSRLFEKFKNHPRIQSLGKASNRAPSYVDSNSFADAVIDSLPDFYGLPDRYNTHDYRTRCMHPGNLKNTLSRFHSLIPEQYKEKVSELFDNTMDRFSGRYKRFVQRNLFLIGIVFAAVLNADTISIFKKIHQNEGLRSDLVAEAVDVTNKYSTYVEYLESRKNDLISSGGSTESIDSLIENSVKTLAKAEEVVVKELNKATNVSIIGWKNEMKPEGSSWFVWLLLKIVGFAITGAAISMGGPFWFDLLTRLVPLRGTGSKPGKSVQPAAQG